MPKASNEKSGQRSAKNIRDRPEEFTREWRASRGTNNAYVETTHSGITLHKVEFDWQEDGTGRLIVHNPEKHTYVEASLTPETVQKLAGQMGVAPPKAGGPGHDNVYIETTTPYLHATKVEFTRNADGTGQFVANNPEKHTYVEVNMDAKTAERICGGGKSHLRS
jgi:hypothetical protein